MGPSDGLGVLGYGLAGSGVVGPFSRFRAARKRRKLVWNEVRLVAYWNAGQGSVTISYKARREGAVPCACPR